MPPAVFSIPSTVLSDIFEYAEEITTNDNYYHHPFQMAISHTCSGFREIALKTPKLWTFIAVTNSTKRDSVIELLTRSRLCGLDLRIKLLEDYPVTAMDANNLLTIMQHIVKNSFRWRTLSVKYTQGYDDHPITMGILSASAPVIQAFSMTVEDVNNADSTQVNRNVNLPHIMATGTPKLKFVRLRGFGIHFFRPPLNVVETLHLDQTRLLPIHYSTLHQIVTCSPFLANLSIYGTLVQNMPVISIDVMHLPNLRSLRLCSLQGDVYPAILNALDAPNLNSLTLSSLMDNDLMPLAIMSPSTRQAWFSTLKHLTFINCNLHAHSYEHLFRVFPNIVSFTMSSHASSLLHSLRMAHHTTTGDGVPWPHLRTLRLTVGIWNANQIEIGLAFYARAMYGHPISTFVIMAKSLRRSEVSVQWANLLQKPDVEICTDDVVWPEGSFSYIDCDDDLFQS